MNTKKMAKRLKDSGVSPVIATILMVAITVVLAAVLYVMVSGFTHSPGTANSAGLNEATVTSPNGVQAAWNISVSSVSANNIPLTSLKIVVNGTTFTYSASGTPAYGGITMTAGASSGHITVVFYQLAGNSATYLNTGDVFGIYATNSAAATALSGATVTLYSGGTDLGSVSL